MAILAVCFVSNIIAEVVKEPSEFFGQSKSQSYILRDCNSTSPYVINTNQIIYERRNLVSIKSIILSPIKWVLFISSGVLYLVICVHV